MIGKTLSHYEVTDLLGKGGMGEVYRARDTKLDREVALKLLPSDIGKDAERLARFRREAKVLASLNHANIASIHGLEEDQGQIFLVLELAEGEDLDERIRRGPLPVEEALSVARQLAHGLEQAHERNVVHRDLKPANVKLAPEGTVKILDFGLARALAGESADEGDPATSPTITAAMTQAGTILGTAAYMSPEQARGMEVDRRADIWAFGVIVFEMLTGKRLFEGETISDTLAEVLKTEPDFDDLPEDTPLVLRWLVERCLQKRPSKRLRDIGEARFMLESDSDQLPTTSSQAKAVVVVEKPGWVIPALIGAAAIALLLGFWLSGLFRAQEPAGTQVHATILPPPGTQIRLFQGGNMAVSPDGSRIVFAAVDSTGTVQLWVRRLDSPAAHLLSGTQGASYPFWSYDGRKIGFFADEKLKKIDSAGGVATTVCDAQSGRGGTWMEDDRILFTPASRSFVHIVPASGGNPQGVTQTDSTEWSHRWAAILPDQKHFLYLRRGDSDDLMWQSLESGGDAKVLLTDVNRGMYGDGHLFFCRDSALWARPFNPDAGEFLGEELLVAESVMLSSNYGSGVYSVSENGVLVYAVGVQARGTLIGVFDEEGTELDRIEFADLFVQDPNLSPDGRYLALGAFPLEEGTGPDIWIQDLQRGTLSRFTSGEDVDDPVWSPEGDRIIYSTQNHVMRIRSTRGARDAIAEVNFHDDAISHDWSLDGEYILYTTDKDGDRDIYVLPVKDPDSRYPLVENEHINMHPSFSPDGNWVAYMSDESGERQVYVREFDLDGGTWQVSPGFGMQPRFSGDGTRIYYLASQGLVATPVTFTENGPEFGAEELILRDRIMPGVWSNTHRYDISADGSRIVGQMELERQDGVETALELVLGWREIISGP